MANRVKTPYAPEARYCKTAGALLRRLRWLKDQLAEIDEERKKINKEIDAIEKGRLPEMLQGADLESIKEAGIGSAKIVHDAYVYVPAAAREAFHEWLREQGEGSLIKEAVHPQTLQARIRRAIENGEALPPSHLCTITPYTAVKFRRS